jgi:hypothetical protein
MSIHGTCFNMDTVLGEQINTDTALGGLLGKNTTLGIYAHIIFII